VKHNSGTLSFEDAAWQNSLPTSVVMLLKLVLNYSWINQLELFELLV